MVLEEGVKYKGMYVYACMHVCIVEAGRGEKKGEREREEGK